MGNIHILNAVHQQHNLEVRDETYNQLNSYGIRHYCLNDYGMFPDDIDRHAIAAAGSTGCTGLDGDDSSHRDPDYGCRADVDSCHSDARACDQHARRADKYRCRIL